jgi:PKD repeat protein
MRGFEMSYLNNKCNFSLLIIVLFLFSTQLFSQTRISIAPGESAQVSREHSISILPITDVDIQILGVDYLYVAGTIDSFRVISGILKVKTSYSLFVTSTAPGRELMIQVRLLYKADVVLSQEIREDFIIDADVQPSVVAEFTANPIQGSAPLIVQFNNQSTGDIVGYFWDFGDSTTSSEQNPQHIYQNAGNYSVTLTVFNFNVQNQLTKENYITVEDFTSLTDDSNLQPDKVNLYQNYPNPFNPATTIEFDVKKPGIVVIDIYNNLGEKIKNLINSEFSAGRFKVKWDGTDEFGNRVSTGKYYYQLQLGDTRISKQMLLIK